MKLIRAGQRHFAGGRVRWTPSQGPAEHDIEVEWLLCLEARQGLLRAEPRPISGFHPLVAR